MNYNNRAVIDTALWSALQPRMQDFTYQTSSAFGLCNRNVIQCGPLLWGSISTYMHQCSGLLVMFPIILGRFQI